MPFQIVIQVAEISQVGEARRAAVKTALAAGFNEVDQGRVGIVATELGTNLIHHAQQGKLLIQTLDITAGRCIELLSLDTGPGIGNVNQSLSDGFSTAGTAGNGLGAIRRISDEFDIYSQRGQGTVVVSRIRATTRDIPKPNDIEFGAITIPAPYETLCGDCWRLFDQDGGFSIMVADGLGHGPLASEAAENAAKVFEENPMAMPQVFLQNANRALMGTRGAAIAFARIELGERSLKYAGVGNISGNLNSESQSRGLCSHNGTVGVQLLRVQEFNYPLGQSNLLVMHSDGLQTRWNFERYPGLTQRHPAVIAGVLYRDFVRGRDDVTVVVARIGLIKASRA